MAVGLSLNIKMGSPIKGQVAFSQIMDLFSKRVATKTIPDGEENFASWEFNADTGDFSCRAFFDLESERDAFRNSVASWNATSGSIYASAKNIAADKTETAVTI